MNKLRACLKAAAILGLLAIIWGCGSGGGTSSDGVSKLASVSIIALNIGDYSIQTDGIDNVASMELTLSYANMNGPYVKQGSLINGATKTTTSSPGATRNYTSGTTSANTPGTIKITIVSSKPISGSGQIASISFDAGLVDSSTITLDSVKMFDPNGNPVQ